LCLKGDVNSPGFPEREPELLNKFIDVLESVAAEMGCYFPVYCFMPDHQHLIITGRQKDSDIWKTIVRYKQKTGFWLSKSGSWRWQKDFYDHIIKSNEDVAIQVKYILDNPVRKGLVRSWEEYPFKGSIGCRLEDILAGIM
jgi:REP element-mobilizing transposase RayT